MIDNYNCTLDTRVQVWLDWRNRKSVFFFMNHVCDSAWIFVRALVRVYARVCVFLTQYKIFILYDPHLPA